MDNKTIKECIDLIKSINDKIKTKTKMSHDNSNLKLKEEKDNSKHIDSDIYNIIDHLTIIGYIFSLLNTLYLIIQGETIITQNIYYHFLIIIGSLISLKFIS